MNPTVQERLWNYLFKILDALVSFRTIAILGAVYLLLHQEQLKLDAETVKYITAAVLTWVFSDTYRPTSRPTSPTMALVSGVAETPREAVAVTTPSTPPPIA